MVEKVLVKLDSLEASGLDCIPVVVSSHQSTSWSIPPIEYILSPFSSDLKIDLFTNLPFTHFTSLSNITNAGAELIKDFATTKILWAKRAMPLATGKKSFKFSITVIWGHFCGIMELLLNNYLGIGTFYLWENFCVSFQRNCNKANTLVTC